jgi:hypothetical protein
MAWLGLAALWSALLVPLAFGDVVNAEWAAGAALGRGTTPCSRAAATEAKAFEGRFALVKLLSLRTVGRLCVARP